MIAAKSIRFIKFRIKANLSGHDQNRRMNSIVKKAMHKVSITQKPNFLLKYFVGIASKMLFFRKWANFGARLTGLGQKMTKND